MLIFLLQPLEDQQLAGLIMWMPGGIVYFVTAAVFFLAWLGAEERRVMREPLPGTAAKIARVRLKGAAVTLAGLLSACGKTPAVAVPGGDPREGKAQIVAYGCGSCHMIPGVDQARGMVGPPLTAFARRTYIAGEVPNTVSSLVQWIMTPQEIEPGTAMPNLGVTESQARDIAAYLYTLR